MVAVARIISSPATRSDPVHYHVFLSSVMMSRFGQLTKLVAFASWACSVVVGVTASQFGLLWAILPIRALLVFIAAFEVLIFRKAYLTVSNRTHPNLFLAVAHQILSKEFLYALLVFTSSGLCFFSLIKNQFEFPWTTFYKAYEPPVVNEYWCFITSYAMYLGVFYAVCFTCFEYQLVRFPLLPTKKLNPLGQRVAKDLNPTFILAFIYSLFTTATYPIVYSLFVRRIWWSLCVRVIRTFTKLHRSKAYVMTHPAANLSVLLIMLFSAFMLFCLWGFVSSAFNIYMSLGPSHRGMLVSEKSTDPNGTLVTGLRANPREFTHTMAFQELYTISTSHQDRRRGIYKDIERDPEPTIWSQINKEAIRVIQTVNKKLEKPAPKPVEEVKKEKPAPMPSNAQLTVKHDDSIFATTAKPRSSSTRTSMATKRLVENLQDDNAETSQHAINIAERATSTLKQQLGKYTELALRVLETPVGYPFRCTLERKSVSIVPNPSLVHCALASLRYMVAHSAEEDQYGIVHRDINQILTELDKMITLIEDFLASPPLHWTDVLAKSGQHKPNTTRMRSVHDNAVTTFDVIVDVFGEQLGQLKLGPQAEQRAMERLAQLDNGF